MDAGAVVWILIFLVLAVVQGVGQKRKEMEKENVPKPEREPVGAGASRGRTRAPSRPLPRTSPEEDSSEGMVPSEIWEEILGLARKPESRPTPLERGSRPEPPERPRRDATSRGAGPAEETASFEALSVEPVEVREDRPRARSRVREAARIQEPSLEAVMSAEILTSRHAAGKGTRRRAHRGRRIRRDLLGHGSSQDLQTAMILTEVLGPPVSLRKD